MTSAEDKKEKSNFPPWSNQTLGVKGVTGESKGNTIDKHRSVRVRKIITRGEGEKSKLYDIAFGTNTKIQFKTQQFSFLEQFF